MVVKLSASLNEFSLLLQLNLGQQTLDQVLLLSAQLLGLVLAQLQGSYSYLASLLSNS